MSFVTFIYLLVYLFILIAAIPLCLQYQQTVLLVLTQHQYIIINTLVLATCFGLL